MCLDPAGSGSLWSSGAPTWSIFASRLWRELWQFFSFTFGFAMFIAGMPLVLERRLTWAAKPFGPEQVGYTWAFAGLLGIFLQGPLWGDWSSDLVSAR